MKLKRFETLLTRSVDAHEIEASHKALERRSPKRGQFVLTGVGKELRPQPYSPKRTYLSPFAIKRKAKKAAEAASSKKGIKIMQS